MENAAIELNLPDTSDRKNETFTRFTHAGKEYILFIKIQADSDASSPSEDADKNAFLVYGHRDFTVNGPDEEKAREVHEAKSTWEETHHVWPVFAYIHSGVHLQLGTDAGLPDRQWDVSMCGYCLVTRDASDIPEPRKYAEGMIETWNQYLSGDVWGYDIELHKLQTDSDGDPIEERDYYERHSRALDEDSCWGFYGSEYALQETKSIAEGIVNAITSPQNNSTGEAL
jgi:hypothetical protein